MDRGKSGARQGHHACRPRDRRVPHHSGHRRRRGGRRGPRHHEGGLRLQDTQGGLRDSKGGAIAAHRQRLELHGGTPGEPGHMGRHRYRGPDSGNRVAL